jgi:hypothetical protein
MSINGYSERGIINSIAYFLDGNPQYINEFLKVLGIDIKEGEYDYEFIIEQSFSDFGDSDLIIIVENKQKNQKKVVFIECKIKTCQGNFDIFLEFNKISNAIKNSKKFTGISSNLFVQLYYKYLLIKTDGKSINDLSVNPIFKKTNNKDRHLGNNKIVTNAFQNKIMTNANNNFKKNLDNYYFVAITTATKYQMDDKEFKVKMNELNLIQSKNVYLCYWGDIEDFFRKIQATKVIEVFNYNNGQIY